jgi:ribonuclease HI
VFQRAKAVRRKTVPRKRARDDSEDPDDVEVTSDWSTPSQNLRTRKARVVEPARAAEPARIPTRHPDKATKRVLKAHRRAQNALLGLPQYQSKSKTVRKMERKQLFMRMFGDQGRVFAGSININDRAARMNDADRLKDFENHYNTRQALVYWTDGSYTRSHGGTAVVVWHEPGGWATRGYNINGIISGAQEAEIYAIAKAFQIAADTVKLRNTVSLVRIFTDSQADLQGLLRRIVIDVGPLIAGKYALHILHERSAWLEEQGVRVELVWVKGHCKSAGNKLADRTARFAIDRGQRFSTLEDTQGHAIV